MGYDVFVSYSTQDKLFADALVNNLENQKIRCWYAPRDIPPGVTWPSAITGAIKQTPVMVLIFSASANDSEEVSRELALASSNRCVVIPVRIENVAPSEDLEYHLTNRHWLDVHDMEFEAAIAQLMEVIESYTHLFRRTGDEAPAPAGDAPAGRLIKDLARRKKLKKFIPALLLVVLCGLGFLWFVKDEAESSLRPQKNTPIYVYSGMNGEIIRTLQLESEYEAEPEFLLQISGIKSVLYNDRIFHCVKLVEGEEWRFRTIIDGERRIIFTLKYGHGTFFMPDSISRYYVVYKDTDSSWSGVQSMLDSYDRQEKERQKAGKP